MSELAYKRRLRERKRRITTTLEAQGYSVSSFDYGPFHLLACRGADSRAIRISFTVSDEREVGEVSRYAVPPSCRREIWQISPDGRVLVIGKVAGAVKGEIP